MRLEIGNRVRCADGEYGELADIVIDPLEKRLTHLVVRPRHGDGEARLVPIRLAKARDDEEREIELECTLDEAQRFESVRGAEPTSSRSQRLLAFRDGSARRGYDGPVHLAPTGRMLRDAEVHSGSVQTYGLRPRSAAKSAHVWIR
jgi:sporulation protein YlmC with PRC-barrel domain